MKELYIVIHTTPDLSHVLEQCKIAFDSGANGIFLIDHYGENLRLIQQLKLVINSFPYFFVGVNALGWEISRILYHLRKNKIKCNAIWIDNANIGTNPVNPFAESVYKIIKEEGILLFGGIAFKYQKEVEFAHLGKTTKNACNFMDIVTTSGKATGVSASIKKINIMADNIHPNKRLAVASGITPENILNYEKADCFLVATGVSLNGDFHKLDGEKIVKLAKTISKINDGEIK